MTRLVSRTADLLHQCLRAFPSGRLGMPMIRYMLAVCLQQNRLLDAAKKLELGKCRRHIFFASWSVRAARTPAGILGVSEAPFA